MDKQQHTNKKILDIKSIQEYLNKLPVFELDIYTYIDSNHLFMFINEVINADQYILNSYLDTTLDKGKKKRVLSLKKNEYVYDEFIKRIFKDIEVKIREDFIKKSNFSLINPFDIFINLFGKEIDTDLTSKKVLNILKENPGSNYSFNTPPEYQLQINHYVKIYRAKLDNELLVRKLKKTLNYHLNDPNKAERIRAFINFYEGDIEQSFNNNSMDQFRKQQDIDRKNYNIALDSFDKKYSNTISQVTLGKTNVKINPRNTILLSFNEKRVDSALIVDAMKDLNLSKNENIFSFITNDTDFAPLFSEIKSLRELYWTPCITDMNKIAKDLEKIAEPIYHNLNYERQTGKRLPWFNGCDWWYKHQIINFIDDKIDIDEIDYDIYVSDLSCDISEHCINSQTLQEIKEHGFTMTDEQIKLFEKINNMSRDFTKTGIKKIRLEAKERFEDKKK